MMIRKECLGTKITKKSPYNAEVFTVVISNDPENFELYRVLQLDVFETNIPAKADVIESETVEVGIIEALKPKKKKKD